VGRGAGIAAAALAAQKTEQMATQAQKGVKQAVKQAQKGGRAAPAAAITPSAGSPATAASPSPALQSIKAESAASGSPMSPLMTPPMPMPAPVGLKEVKPGTPDITAQAALPSKTAPPQEQMLATGRTGLAKLQDAVAHADPAWLADTAASLQSSMQSACGEKKVEILPYKVAAAAPPPQPAHSPGLSTSSCQTANTGAAAGLVESKRVAFCEVEGYEEFFIRAEAASSDVMAIAPGGTIASETQGGTPLSPEKKRKLDDINAECKGLEHRLAKAAQLKVQPTPTNGGAEVLVDLQFDQPGAWKKLCLRVDTATYPRQPPSAIYPNTPDSRSRVAVAARSAFERAMAAARPPVTVASLGELWASSVVETSKAHTPAAGQTKPPVST